MNEPLPLRWLHGAAIRVQLPLVLCAIPLVAAMYGVALAPIVVEVVLPGIDGAAAQAALLSARAVLVAMLACITVTTIGAALLLRGSIRAVVQQLQHATGAIARGEFQHRIGTRRHDELGQLAESIDAMAEHLERLERARRQLLASVSHELRTPLTIIQGLAYTLARDEPAGPRLERLELMQAESIRLARIIDDLLEASSIHAGSVRLQVEECELGALLDQTRRRFRDVASARDIQIVLDAPQRPVSCELDPARIEQVIGNLLSNAIRHADAGSKVTLGLAAPRRRGRGCRITVANRGTPIGPRLAAILFEPFTQGSDHSGRVGLGLTVARGLTLAHGGSLMLDEASAAQGMVVFSVQLPQHACRKNAPARPGREHSVEVRRRRAHLAGTSG